MQRRREAGFTLIELMLAMTFISILLLAIALTAIQVGKMYNRGITLRTINSTGRYISDVIRRDFLQTDRRLVSGSESSSVITISEGAGEGRRSSGRFCLGSYSYAWNVPPQKEDAPINAAVLVGPDDKPINFVRVVDEGASLCQAVSGRYPSKLNDATKITHLLKQQDDTKQVVLAIHSLDAAPATWSENSGEGLYKISFVVGTSRLEEINTTNQTCKPPADDQSNTEFCAINKFEMIVRTNG